MLFRQLLNDDTACASYVLGCKSKGRLAVMSENAFAEALLRDIPPPPPQQEAIVAANGAGRTLADTA